MLECRGRHSGKSFMGKDQGVLVHTELNLSQQCISLQERSLTASWVSLHRALWAGWGKLSFPSAHAWWAALEMLIPWRGSPLQGRWNYWQEWSNRAAQWFRSRRQHLMYEDKLRDLGLLSLQRRRFRKILLVSKYKTGMYKAETDFFCCGQWENKRQR